MVELSVSRLFRRWMSMVAILVVAAAVLPVASTVLPGSVAVANAASCPQVEVVFARGRTEPPGVGTLGNAFVSALRNRVNKNIGVYAVRYPADTEVDIGANDMSQHIQYMMNNCPDTRLVIGGYSLGAAVADVVLAVPFTAMGFKNPLPAGADEHIAAVALFGNGAGWVGPISNFSPAYRDRTIELCHGADPICNPADPNTWQNNWPDHLAGAYIDGGMVNQAADFVAGRL
ncbi:cutinase [Mycobacterium frederiksbergense]|uniref:Cutinase n=2 Tax=Mycolicibacterium frederiksbergense TaxID=117567 RepID=A0ABT6L4B4_9MYCO|nr:cutinase [Mycolicibacterium frederiksbergense]